MANCASNCSGANNEILAAILNQDRAFFVRLSQVVQAFETANSTPQSNQGALEDSIVSNCPTTEVSLLTAILTQRAFNFNQLGLVLVAAA